MRVVAFVPAKGQSDRIANKNTAILDGEHLFKRKLRQLLNCDLIDDVYLDTEFTELIELASDLYAVFQLVDETENLRRQEFSRLKYLTSVFQ